MSVRTASRAMLLPWISEKTATRISIRLNGPGPKTLLFRRKMSPPPPYALHESRRVTGTLLVIKRTIASHWRPIGWISRYNHLQHGSAFACPIYSVLAA